MKVLSIIVLIAAFALVLPANAQTSATVKPDFAPMTYFVGLWNCKFVKNPDPKLVGASLSFAGATDPDGYWEVLDFQNGRINITRDGASDHWAWIYLGSGGDYGVMSTPGWSGNTLTLTDVLSYGGAPLGKSYITKLSDTQYRGTYAVQSAAGPENYETVCTRV